MNTRRIKSMVFGVTVATCHSMAVAGPVGTPFTYQGRLMDNGTPANGPYDFEFTLWTDDDAGSRIGDYDWIDDHTVVGGLFTVMLNTNGQFGGDAFNGQALWLQVGVRPGADSGPDPYTILIPRQPVTPAPYASAIPFLRTVQNPVSPNILGGVSGAAANQILWDAVGVTISGGGRDGFGHVVAEDYSVIGGGLGNKVWDFDDDPTNGAYGTVSGGEDNSAGHLHAAVGGGFQNTANGEKAAIAGGRGNAAGGGYSFIGGGDQNTASASYTVVAGGRWNVASGLDSAVGGGDNNVADGSASVVAGGYNNGAYGYGSVVAGGNNNTASGDASAVGGGQDNEASGAASVVAGGLSNLALDNLSVVGGGTGNTASGNGACVPGGWQNTAAGDYSLAGGRWASAFHLGCFVWSSSASPFESTAADQFLIKADGGVGLGTNNPAAQLHVRAETTSATDNTAQFIAPNIGPNASHVHFGTNGDWYIRSAAVSGKVVIQDSGGNVGIGTNSPVAQLHVQAETTSTSDNTAQFIAPNIGPIPSHIHFGTTGDWYIRSAAAAGKVVIQDSGGNVGIGTNSPTQKLYVVGNICATGTIGACSDRRFKRNVQPMTGALETVGRLSAVSFEWDTEHHPELKLGAGRQIGFIAQDVKPVVPQAVAQGEDGYYSVDYGRLTPLLVEAVKELQNQLAAKDRQIDELRARLERLEARASTDEP